MLVHRRLSFFVATCLFSSSLLYYLVISRKAPTHQSDDELLFQKFQSPTTKGGEEIAVLPMQDNFPLGDHLDSLPDIPSWNRPPSPHVLEKTPLFIGVTRNWFYLQQTVLSYIIAGWPPSDIYVVDNTGTMKANYPPHPQLSLENPFFVNVTRLTQIFGVNVISTPTVLTFAQLQNFYLYIAMERDWDYYFWGHMDTIIYTDERYGGGNSSFKALYLRSVDLLRESMAPDYEPWATRFLAYDWLALNNVAAFVELGGWDTAIPFYKSDCDMYERIKMAGLPLSTADTVGSVTDIGGLLDLNILFRKKTDPSNPPQNKEQFNAAPEWNRGDESYDVLVDAVAKLDKHGWYGPDRNFWQDQQTGGQGEPFYRDAEGFRKSLQILTDAGYKAFEEKWGGYDRCDLLDHGFQIEEAWNPPKRLLDPEGLKWIWKFWPWS